MDFQIAFYKGTSGAWWHKAFSVIVRWWDKGPYSHCELVFTDGRWGTATGDGVILRKRDYVPSEWDFVRLPADKEAGALAWFESHKGKAYDYTGLLRFMFGFLNPSRDKWFCSRACADALGLSEGWRESPNGLHSEIFNFMESRE